MDEYEIKEEFATQDEPAAGQPAHVKIMLWLVFVPAVILFLIWGFLDDVVARVVPGSTRSLASMSLYYLGLAAALVMGIGLLILIAGYFGARQPSEKNADDSN